MSFEVGLIKRLVLILFFLNKSIIFLILYLFFDIFKNDELSLLKTNTKT